MGVWNPGPAGTENDDVFDGAGIAELAEGLGGDDVLNGNGGDDLLDGGAGIDSVNGGAGNDLIAGGVGADVLNGGDGADGLYDGALGADIADEDVDTLWGGAGNDNLRGGLQDIFEGGDGEDTVVLLGRGLGFAPQDFVLDLRPLDLGGDFNLPGGGVVRADVEHVLVRFVVYDPDTLETNLDAWTIYGSDATEVFLTSGGDSVVFGGAGDDTIEGWIGADHLSGEAGDDRLIGGAGADVLSGGDDGDYIRGFTPSALAPTDLWDDELDGGDGNDELVGNIGDTFLGGSGEDIAHFQFQAVEDAVLDLRDLEFLDGVFSGTVGGRVISGIEWISVSFLYDEHAGGSLQFEGSNGGESVAGSVGADTIHGNGGNDGLSGLEGDDVLDGGAGDDAMFGGAGNDTYYVDSILDRTTEEFGEGTDLVISEVSLTLGLHIENASLTGGANANLTGNNLANALTGNSGANTLLGGEGDDILLGGGGDDVLDGGDGANILNGGDGDDLFLISQGQKVDTYTGGAGVDTLDIGGRLAIFFDASLSSIDRMVVHKDDTEIYFNAEAIGPGLSSHLAIDGGNETIDLVFELHDAGKVDLSGFVFSNWSADSELVLTGSDGKDILIGSAVDDFIEGRAGDNTIDGGLGADRMFGGSGNDTFIVDNARDVTGGGLGIDRVKSSVSRLLSADLENLTLTGSNAINGIGNFLANIITGNGAANTLNGKEGADTMSGGGGNDIYIVDNIGDLTKESSSSGGVDLVKSSVTRTLNAYIENLTLAGASAINGTGNSLDNRITGNSAANVLNGGSGDDMLSGGLGADILTGGSGADTFIFNTAASASNRDRITDFNVAADTIGLENAVFTALGSAGTLASGAFFQGPAAHDASDRIIYNPASGALIYDSNGNAPGGAVQIATLSAGLTLTNADFLVI